MAKTKQLTPKFMTALFKRGKKEYLPLSYLLTEAEKVLAEGEAQKIPGMLSEFKEKGLVEVKDEKYKALSEFS